MDVTELKALEAQARPAPWEGIPLSAPNIPFLVAMRNLAPELLDLWEACNHAKSDSQTDEFGDSIQIPIKLENAIGRLNEKAATMAV